jgi:L-ascorbate metabolism protein UlaG (beta-lactamase superfamily)
MPRKTAEIKGLTVEWLGHNSVRIYGKKIVYIDPFSEVLKAGDEKADLIVSTHAHRDHFDVDAINKLTKDGTHVVIKSGCDRTELSSESIKEIEIDETCKIDDIEVKGVPAYNVRRFRSPGEPFHPEGFGMGAIVAVDGVKFYYAGDTDYIPVMKDFASENIEVAFLPIGGTYTMDLDEASAAAEAIKSKIIVPVHYNHLKGTEADPIAFKEKVEKMSKSKVFIL